MDLRFLHHDLINSTTLTLSLAVRTVSLFSQSALPCMSTQQQLLTLVMWLWSAVWRLKTAWTLNTFSMRAIMGHALGMRVAFDSCICQYRLHVGVHYSHVMTGTRVILDFQLRLRNGSGRIVTAPCSDNAMLITQCSHCCISFATELETSTWLFPLCDSLSLFLSSGSLEKYS